MQKKLVRKALCLSLAVGIAQIAQANDSKKADPSFRLPQIDVIGQKEEDLFKLPGSVAVITSEELRLSQPRSTEEALRNVPGIVIKPEEESAIVANIGVRGLSAADYKTLILEDGVPVAPGLFVGNGRYYNPRVQHMESIEVLKGAASLRYGPSTIGGVINYITKQPEEGVVLSGRAGSFDTREATLELGAKSKNDDAVFGAIITKADSDGFLDKDYEMDDVILKAGIALSDDQWVGMKYSYYKNDANISYRGYFLDEYRRRDQHNPAPDDYFLTDRKAVDVNHEWEINDAMRLNTLLFWSETTRDYWRYGVNNAASRAQKTWVYNNTVNGNNRFFDRKGFDTRLQIDNNLFGMNNEAEIGIRYMEETMDDKTINATRSTPRTGTLGKDVTDSADSTALYLQNRFGVTDRLAVTPGLRVEHYTQERKDLRLATNNKTDTDNTEAMPGIGFTYEATPVAQIFGGAYKAFSPALNGDALDGMTDQKLDAERSLNIELGVRGRGADFNYEAAIYSMDFDNQIIPANSNSAFQNTNGGKTLHQGIEAAFGLDLGEGFSFDVNTTYVFKAEFNGNRYDAGALTTKSGNRVTYTPEWVANATLKHQWQALTTSFSANYVDKQYTDAANTKPITENTSGFFTGEINSYTTYNLNAAYQVTPDLDLSASVKNVFDKRYIASLRQGIYVGTEHSFDVGFRYKF